MEVRTRTEDAEERGGPVRVRGVGSRKQRAFSLVELLLVMAVLTVLIGMIGPTVVGIQQGLDLSNATDQVAAMFRKARLLAKTQNDIHEIRFLDLPSTGLPVEDEESQQLGQSFRAVGIWRLVPGDPSNTGVLVGELYRFPDTIVAKAVKRFSTILTEGREGQLAYLPAADARGVSFRAIAFKPNGGTAFVEPDQELFITLWDEVSLVSKGAAEGLRRNFVTIQLNPVSGGIQIYRP